MPLMQLGLVVWGLFMAGLALTTLLIVTARAMENRDVARGYEQVNAQCTPSRVQYTAPRPITKPRPARPEPAPVRPEPARVPARLRKIEPEESGFLVLNWPVRNPAEPIERN